MLDLCSLLPTDCYHRLSHIYYCDIIPLLSAPRDSSVHLCHTAVVVGCYTHSRAHTYSLYMDPQCDERMNVVNTLDGTQTTHGVSVCVGPLVFRLCTQKFLKLLYFLWRSTLWEVFIKECKYCSCIVTGHITILHLFL